MKKFVIQNRKIFVAACIAVILCVVTVLHFTKPQNEQIPRLKLPVAGNIATENIRVSIEDTAESEIDNVSQSLTVYRLKPVNPNQEKQKIGELFQISSSDIGTFPTGNTLPDGTTVGIDAQTGRWFYQKPIDFDATGGPLSDADAIQIAEQFIADNNLYPVQELGDAKVGTTSTGDAAQGTEEILRKMCISTLRLPANLYMEHFVSAFPYPGAEKSLVLTSLQMNIPWLMLMSKARTIVR